MTDSRYAPPQAKVADIDQSGTAPPLWNPNAAANWSLLLTPAFGAYLHMRNWEALGEPDKAAGSRRWIYVTLGMFALVLIISIIVGRSEALDATSRVLGLALLLSWYFGSGRAQAVYVKTRFGKDYERRSWGKPLLVGFCAFLGYFFVVGLLIGVLVSVRGH